MTHHIVAQHIMRCYMLDDASQSVENSDLITK